MYRLSKTVRIENAGAACRLRYKDTLFCPSEESAPPSGDDIISAARQEAERILSGAKEKAAEILNGAIEKAARDAAEAKAAAEEAGEREGRERYAGKIRAAEEFLKEMAAEKERLLSELAPQLVKISVEIADKYLRGCLETDVRVIEAAMHGALEKVSQAEDITIRLSPENFENVDELKAAVNEHLSRLCRVEFKEDEALPPAEVIVETELGTVEAGVDTYIGEVKKAFAEEFAAAL